MIRYLGWSFLLQESEVKVYIRRFPTVGKRERQERAVDDNWRRSRARKEGEEEKGGEGRVEGFRIRGYKSLEPTRILNTTIKRGRRYATEKTKKKKNRGERKKRRSAKPCRGRGTRGYAWVCRKWGGREKGTGSGVGREEMAKDCLFALRLLAICRVLAVRSLYIGNKSHWSASLPAIHSAPLLSIIYMPPPLATTQTTFLNNNVYRTATRRCVRNPPANGLSLLFKKKSSWL